MAKEDFWRRREEEFRMMEEDEKSMLWGNMPCMQGTIHILRSHFLQKGRYVFNFQFSKKKKNQAKITTQIGNFFFQNVVFFVC